jgi:hypothetical protein
MNAQTETAPICMLLDSKDRVKEYSQGRALLVHSDFHPEAPPYRRVCGEEAAARYRQYRQMTCRRFLKMLNEPEFAERAARTIQRLKDEGKWIEPDEETPR